MVVRKNTAQDTKVQEKKKKKKKVTPSSDYLDVLMKKGFGRTNPIDFGKAASAKPLTKNGKMMKQFLESFESGANETSNDTPDFDQALMKFFEMNGKTLKNKGGKMLVFDGVEEKVSDAEMCQKGTANQKGFRISKEAEKEIKSSEEQLCFKLIDSYAEGLKNLKKFADVHDTRMKLGIFLAIPQAAGITLSALARHMDMKPQSLDQYRFHDQTEAVRQYILKRHIITETPKVLSALMKAASEQGAFGGYNTQAMKLFLQYAESWKEGIDLNHDVKGGFNVTFGVQPSPYMQPEDVKKDDDEDSDDSE